MKATPSRPYVGIFPLTGKRETFRSVSPPTEASHPSYAAVIGPFRTMRAARLMAEVGHVNPHIQCVADAERIARALHLAQKGITLTTTTGG